MECKTMSVAETMLVLGIKPTKTNAMIQSGEIPSFKLGRRRLILRDGIDNLLNGGSNVKS